jgi:hypothetical protein
LWRAEPGKYGIELARSAADVQARTEIELTAPVRISVRD